MNYFQYLKGNEDIVFDVMSKIHQKRKQDVLNGYSNKDLAKMWGISVEGVRKYKNRYNFLSKNNQIGT